MNESKPLMTCRKSLDEIETRGAEHSWESSMGGVCLRTMRSPALRWHELGAWRLCGTWEPSGPMLTEKSKRQNRKGESRNAAPRGGTTRSSDEVPDKGMERRGRVDEASSESQPERGGANG